MVDATSTNRTEQSASVVAEEHHGLAKYFYVFLALCLLTTASFFTYTEWWRSTFSAEFSWAFMLIVSGLKALLVILFFMHVKYEASWKYALTVPAVLLALFLVGMLIPDIGLRGRSAAEEVIRYEALPQAPR